MKSINFFFSGWEPIARILIVGTLAYIALIFLLRISSKRTVAKMNAFDFIITVALGASFGRILTAKSVPIAEAVTAFSLLVLLQFIVSWLQKKFPRISSLITDEPKLLYYEDKFLQDQMKHERVTVDNLETAIREKGFASFDEVSAIVFESNGKFSVISKNTESNDVIKKLL